MRYSYVKPDYTERAEPEDIPDLSIESLRN